jgi:hypothetical protein
MVIHDEAVSSRLALPHSDFSSTGESERERLLGMAETRIRGIKHRPFHRHHPHSIGFQRMVRA